jgi:hypothetical protein
MRVIDPHAHMTSRTTDDYRDARRSGVECVVEPSFWSGSDKLYPESFFDYFEHIIDFETERAERVAGMDHYVTVAINPKEADDREMAAAVIDRLPEYFDRDRVVGVGEIGFNLQTDAEEWAFTNSRSLFTSRTPTNPRARRAPSRYSRRKAPRRSGSSSTTTSRERWRPRPRRTVGSALPSTLGRSRSTT